MERHQEWLPAVSAAVLGMAWQHGGDAPCMQRSLQYLFSVCASSAATLQLVDVLVQVKLWSRASKHISTLLSPGACGLLARQRMGVCAASMTWKSD